MRWSCCSVNRDKEDKKVLSREEDHIEGLAKECAVVTHYRLKNASDGKGVVVDPEAKLEEELIIRPTSETLIWDTYKNWIQFYRDPRTIGPKKSENCRAGSR